MEKKIIYVCVGSSCHLKGSHQVVKLMREAIKQYNLEEKVEMKATFCLGNCTNGVSVKIDDVVVGFKEETFEETFKEHILSRIG